jgi:hypothetical protein
MLFFLVYCFDFYLGIRIHDYLINSIKEKFTTLFYLILIVF